MDWIEETVEDNIIVNLNLHLDHKLLQFALMLVK